MVYLASKQGSTNSSNNEILCDFVCQIETIKKMDNINVGRVQKSGYNMIGGGVNGDSLWQVNLDVQSALHICRFHVRGFYQSQILGGNCICIENVQIFGH